MIFFRAIKYLKYNLLSGHKKGHGIHSPFVFNLVSDVFRNKPESNILILIEKIRKELKADDRCITVKDLGSGSDKLKANIRKVSDIVRYSAVPRKYGVLLSNMAAEFGGPFIVELGTSLGISAMYLAAGCPAKTVNTVEGCLAVYEIAKENFKKAGINNINVFTGSFDEILPVILSSNNKPGLVFIDGNHRKKPVIDYFGMIAERSDSKSVIIIDDIYYSEEMEEAWNEIKRYEKVSVTIDIFRMGLVFFREGVTHKDYIIRY